MGPRPRDLGRRLPARRLRRRPREALMARERFIPLNVHRNGWHGSPRPVPDLGPPEEVGGRGEALAGDVLPGVADRLRSAELVLLLLRYADAAAMRDHGEATW